MKLGRNGAEFSDCLVTHLGQVPRMTEIDGPSRKKTNNKQKKI